MSWRVSYAMRPAVGVPATANSTAGWTDSFYLPGDLTKDALTNLAQILMIARLNMTTSGWRCDKIRFAVFPSTRQAFKINIPPAAGQGQYNVTPDWGNLAAKDEQPYDVLILNLPSANNRQRNWGMRGIGSDVVDAGGTYTGRASFAAELAAFKAVLVNNAWSLRTRTSGDKNYLSGASISAAIGGVLASPVSPAVAVEGVTAAIRAGDTVRISGVLGFDGLNGEWTVKTVQAPVVVGGSQILTLAPKRGRLVKGAYGGGGFLRVQTFALSPIVDCTAAQGSSHRVGGLPGRLRGRRSKQAS